MTEGVSNQTAGHQQGELVPAIQIAQTAEVRTAANGLCYGTYGDHTISDADLLRMVEAVPSAVSQALSRKVYLFVPLVMSGGHSTRPDEERRSGEDTQIAVVYRPELSDNAVCHRNVNTAGREFVFISSRLLGDRFALAFELYINVAHAFVDAVGVPESFNELAWQQALGDVRGETSQDAWENRNQAVADRRANDQGRRSHDQIDERAKSLFLSAAFSDAVAIYMLSLAVDFEYAELREREYPLLAPQALAERLRHVNKLFPPNKGYEFAIRYRRRS